MYQRFRQVTYVSLLRPHSLFVACSLAHLAVAVLPLRSPTPHPARPRTRPTLTSVELHTADVDRILHGPSLHLSSAFPIACCPLASPFFLPRMPRQVIIHQGSRKRGGLVGPPDKPIVHRPVGSPPVSALLTADLAKQCDQILCTYQVVLQSVHVSLASQVSQGSMLPMATSGDDSVAERTAKLIHKILGSLAGEKRRRHPPEDRPFRPLVLSIEE
jgi:hypothetical protein